MKKGVIILLIFQAFYSYGQLVLDPFKVDSLIKDNFSGYDLSSVWIQSKPCIVLGYLGKHYERFRIHFTSITKDSVNKNLYHLRGKDKVKDIIRTFQGTLVVKEVMDNSNLTDGIAPSKMVKKKKTSVVGEYEFFEDSVQGNAGKLVGHFTTDVYLDAHYHINYDDLEQVSDEYSNNQFEGKWVSYDGKETLKCNWGDYRIPDSRNLDAGLSTFNPNKRYFKNGWQDYINNNEETTGYTPYSQRKFERWWD